MNRFSLVAVLVLAPGCVDRVITDLSGGVGFGGSEGEFPDGESDSAAMIPEPEPEPIPDPPPMGDPECISPTDCAEDQTCFEGTCVGTGQFRVSLSWTVVSDFDLHVLTPSGIEIWYGEPEVAAGYLDVDDCVGGGCRDNEGVHVENVFFNAGAERGTYKVWIVNFDGAGGGEFNLEVDGNATAQFSGNLPSYTGAQSEVFSFEY